MTGPRHIGIWDVGAQEGWVSLYRADERIARARVRRRADFTAILTALRRGDDGAAGAAAASPGHDDSRRN